MLATCSGLTAAILALGTGCGEARDTSDPLGDIAVAYRAALQKHPAVANPDAAPDTAATLRSLARQAGSASGNADPAAAALLSAGIHAKAGAITLALTQRVQSMVDITQGSISSLVADAELLDATAASHESLNLSASRNVLEQSRDDARAGLSTAQSLLDEVRRPIESAIDNRDAGRERAAELDTEAAVLARRGLDAGPLDGHGFIKEAIDLRRRAHNERVEAAREDLTLLDLEPSRRLAEDKRANNQSLLDAARASQNQLDSRRDDATTYADGVRGQISAIQSRIAPLLQQLATEQTQTIVPGFEAAIADFTQSSSAARKATRGNSPAQATDAWFAIAGGELGAGRAHWALAGNLKSRADLLGRLAASGNLLGDGNRWKSERAATLASRETALAAAKTSYEAALESLSQVRGFNTQTAAIRMGITTAISAMEGADLVSMESARRTESTTRPPSGRPTQPRATGSSTAIDRSAPGFSSPQQVVALFEGAPENLSQIEHLVTSTKTSGPEATAIIQLVESGIDAFKPFADACMAKFGKLGSASIFGGLEEQFGAKSVTIQSIDGDRATLVSPDQEEPLTLIKENGRWFLDVDSMLPDDPQTAQMIPMLGMMFGPAIAQIKAAATEIAGEIEAGDFASADEASEAFSEQVDKIVGDVFGSMFGGAGGDGGAGGAGGGFPGSGGGFPSGGGFGPG